MDAIPDRDLLRQRSAEGLRRSVLIACLVGGVVFAGLAGFFFALIDDFHSGRGLLVLTAGLVAAAVVVATTIIVARRMAKRSPLLYGTDRATRTAVTAALRTGGTGDPRIDELARETARRGLNQRWFIGLGVALALLQAFLLVVRLTDREWERAVLPAGSLTLMVVMVVTKTMELRRYRAYLREPSPWT
ncbi:hypothetical protein [Actinoplanes sp. TFC3]|uniref:hypothetical protein n=1 Tax=Actinoplanes sp. TFC3 TaxID=1710355 RepID=UPI00082AEB95|nr:hypothetical protein [Actinoplanes sp. TFC3]